MINFLNPTAFWGLLALIIPTIILLLSKQKQQVVEFGSVVFLETSESKTARKVFPTEWLLYLLRIAIITLLVLIGAEPVWVSEETEKKIWIEKEVAEDPIFQQVMTTLGDEVEIIEPESLSLLITKLNKESDSVVVYTRSYAKNFIGKTPKLGRHIEWRIVPNESELMLKDTFRLGETIQALTISSGENGLKWNTEKIKNEQGSHGRIVEIYILSSSQKQKEKEDLKSLLKAYEGVIPFTFTFDGISPKWTILIDTINEARNRKTITWNNFVGQLELRSVHSDLFEIHGELTKNNLRSSNFPLELAHTILQDELKMEELDRRIYVPKQEVSASPILKAGAKMETVKYGWILIMLLVLLERWLSRKSVNA
ncbi:BatA domain-containing protein [Portibacter lacus]|uniref:Aerotolerance regulator N-terminal domain-containing protein n=1 Tax=Portibacter lacus TaxID=1099794 RepID=A0AA37SP84_9BACT|nr:BatA domain-containing protein [Portibacter lacus]GLR17515.1 hypothetical protein GCM10007940_21300 [Portibacter lacus]